MNADSLELVVSLVYFSFANIVCIDVVFIVFIVRFFRRFRSTLREIENLCNIFTPKAVNKND